jgi:hypothetical protein
MKKLNHFFLLAVVLNEVCGTDDSIQKNTGGKRQCLEAPVKTILLAKDDQFFANRAALDVKATVDAAIAAKQLVPFPNIEGIEPNNTDANIKNGRFTDYTLKAGIRGSSYRFDLSVCTYEALKSYVNSGYTRVYRVTTEGEVTCEIMADGTIKGEKITSFLLGLRNEATDDDVPFANVLLKYANDNNSIVKPAFDWAPLEGIYDVVLQLVSASATSIKFKTIIECTGDTITSFVSGNLQLLDDGEVHASSFVAADADGVYELTGTGFENGFTLGLNGVVTQANIMYESPEVLVISGIA